MKSPHLGSRFFKTHILQSISYFFLKEDYCDRAFTTDDITARAHLFRYIVNIPEGFPLEAAGPVFCAGITMYSPLVHWKVRQWSWSRVEVEEEMDEVVISIAKIGQEETFMFWVRAFNHSTHQLWSSIFCLCVPGWWRRQEGGNHWHRGPGPDGGEAGQGDGEHRDRHLHQPQQGGGRQVSQAHPWIWIIIKIIIQGDWSWQLCGFHWPGEHEEGSLDLILNTVSQITNIVKLNSNNFRDGPELMLSFDYAHYYWGQTCQGFWLADIVQWQVSAEHDLSSYLGLLARKGVMVQLGLVTTPHPVAQLPLMFRKISIAGSLIGGLPETQAKKILKQENNV